MHRSDGGPVRRSEARRPTARQPAARHAAAISLLLALLVGATACTAVAPDPEVTRSPTPSPTPDLRAELSVPPQATTVLADEDPVARSLAASSALFASAPVAVLAPARDVAAQLRAAGVAVSVRAPLILVGSDQAPTLAEVGRLGAEVVLTVGDLPGLDGDFGAVAAPDQDAALVALLTSSRTGTPPRPGAEVEAGGEVAAVAALDPRAPTLLRLVAPTPVPDGEPGGESEEGQEPRAGPTPSASPSEPQRPSPARLPRTAPPVGTADVLVLATGEPGELAVVATARAAGHDVVLVPGGDPRASAATVEAVAAASAGLDHVLAAGPGLGSAERVAWTVATAATGVQLPGGGQTAFAGTRYVALYGTPEFAGLGLLGEQDLPATVVRARDLAAEYQALTTDVVVPTFEIIATVASAGPGEDGNYSNELPAEALLPWVQAAQDAGVYVIIDLQPGRTDFLTQAMAYEELLRYPNVGLALDPEWRLAPDQVHLRQIGSVGIDEVNGVVTWLADLTREAALPQKMLVLHQFTLRMIQGRERLDTSREEVAVVLHVDGQGSQPAKAGTWAALQVGAPAGVRWGWKNFIDEDLPMLTPQQTYQVAPLPDLVTYQ